VLKHLDGSMSWRPASTAPFNCDIEVCLSGDGGSHIIPFPCRQTRAGWINSDLEIRLDIEPREWRPWPDGKAGPVSPGVHKTSLRRARVPPLRREAPRVRAVS
jgi:hypothetical protein